MGDRDNRSEKRGHFCGKRRQQSKSYHQGRIQLGKTLKRSAERERLHNLVSFNTRPIHGVVSEKGAKDLVI